MKDVKGKYIWIIGASSGIGASLAKELANHGAIIALSARREALLMQLKDELTGSSHITIPFDISDCSQTLKAKEEILKNLPHIDSAIFMAASYTEHDGGHKPIDVIKTMIDVNLIGAFNMLEAITPVFEQRQTGQIVLCASVAGYRGLPSGQPYCATKAALISLAESLKIDNEAKNIDVKLICPGFVKTPLTDKNKFTMPMIISSEKAAQYIHKGLCSNKFEIHFPMKFTLMMKILKTMPSRLYFLIARRLKSKL